MRTMTESDKEEIDSLGMMDRSGMNQKLLKEGKQNVSDRANALSVERLIRMQSDFKNEVTLCQYHAFKLGVFRNKAKSAIQNLQVRASSMYGVSPS